MKVIKQGKHRLFGHDPETSRVVSEMLLWVGKFLKTCTYQRIQARLVN
jgi:hypothetical protein